MSFEPIVSKCIHFSRHYPPSTHVSQSTNFMPYFAGGKKTVYACTTAPTGNATSVSVIVNVTASTT